MDNNLIVVRQLPVIEDQLRQVKAGIETRVSEALALACTEETYKTVKKVRAELNKEYAELEQRRKEVKSAILKPYQDFEALYKECAGDIYTTADRQLRERISYVEDGLKLQRVEDAEAYFDEYRESLGIAPEMVSFATSGIHVTLSESRKATRQKVTAFLDRIAADLKMIETQDNREEILVEYKKTLSVSQAVTTVKERQKAVEQARRQRAEAEAARAAKEAAQAKVEQAIAEDTAASGQAEAEQATALAAPEPLAAPEEESSRTNEPQAAEKVYSTSFRVTATLDKLRALKQFLTEGGYQYEQL